MLVGINNKHYNINSMSKSNLRWLRKQMKKSTTTLDYLAGKRSYMRIPVIWNYIAKQRVLIKTGKRLIIINHSMAIRDKTHSYC